MRNKIFYKSFLAVITLTASSGVLSKEISYDFIQGTYGATTVDTGFVDVDGDGLGISGSFSVAPNIALTASYGATSFDTFEGIDIDTTSLSFGVTAHTLIADGTSIFGNLSILKGDFEATDGFDTIDDDDTGNIISIGLRHAATDVIELEAGFSRTDIFDDSENTLGVGARFYANEKFSLGIGYTTSSDADTLLLNVRINI